MRSGFIVSNSLNHLMQIKNNMQQSNITVVKKQKSVQKYFLMLCLIIFTLSLEWSAFNFYYTLKVSSFNAFFCQMAQKLR